MNYENQKDCHLMVYESNPEKRNVNNEIKFNLPQNFNAVIGDSIKCNLGNGRFSVYEVLEVLEIKPSSISKMNYVTAKSKWYLN